MDVLRHLEEEARRTQFLLVVVFLSKGPRVLEGQKAEPFVWFVLPKRTFDL